MQILLTDTLKTPRLRVVPLSLSPSCVTRKKTAKKWPRENLGRVLLAPRISRGHFLCHARRTKRIKHDGLSERGPTGSLENAKKRPLAHTGTLLTIYHRIDSGSVANQRTEFMNASRFRQNKSKSRTSTGCSSGAGLMIDAFDKN